MTVVQEINRIKTAKSNIKNELSLKNITVPSNVKIDGYNQYIEQIKQDPFDYDNWIAYGASAPDATRYKYWVNIDSTPESLPLKQTGEYLYKQYYSGDIDVLAKNGEEIITVELGSKTNSSYGGTTPNNNIIVDGNYAIRCAGYMLRRSNLTNASIGGTNDPRVGIFDITNIDYPISYCANFDNAIDIINIKDICTETCSARGNLTLRDGKIYLMYEDDITRIYDISTKEVTTINKSPLHGKSRDILYMQFYPNSNTTMFIMCLSGDSSLSLTAGWGYDFRVDTGYMSCNYTYTFDINTTYYMSASYILQDNRYIIWNQQTGYASRYAYTYIIDLNNPGTLNQIKMASGTSGDHYMFPVNYNGNKKAWFVNYNTLTMYSFNTSNMSFEAVAVNQLFNNVGKAFLYGCYGNPFFDFKIDNGMYISGIIPVSSSKGFKLDSNGSLYDIYTTKYMYGYLIHNYNMTNLQDISWSIEYKETIDSTNNVLLPLTPNYKANSYSSTYYKFYMNSDMDKFMPIVLKNSKLYGIHNHEEIQIKTSVNNEWVDYNPSDAYSSGYH